MNSPNYDFQNLLKKRQIMYTKKTRYVARFSQAPLDFQRLYCFDAKRKAH